MANQIVRYTMMRSAIITFAFCLSVSFAACSTGPTTSDAVPTAVVAGPVGSIVQREALLGAPDGAAAYRILYRSTGLNNEPILVSGAIIIPQGTPPPGGRPIVAWAHPTSGVEPQCAPSLARNLFRQIQGLRAMVEQGYVVVATDYPGLGTPETHPYLVGVSEGRAVLDSVRAARQMPEAAVGSRFVVWGHSQGGQAALYTGLIAKDYAPELTLAGVAAAAPATDLATLVNDDFNSVGGKNLTAMTLWSWARVYNAPIDRVVAPDAMPVVNRLAGECIESIFDILVRRRTERPLEQSFLTVRNFTAIEPWRSLLASNTPGALPPGIPVFLAQGDADQLVRPAVTRAYMRLLCQAGSRVRMVVVPGVGHGFVARDSAAAAVAWMTDRFAATVPPNDCGS
jgi:acetyl esterase/lipase